MLVEQGVHVGQGEGEPGPVVAAGAGVRPHQVQLAAQLGDLPGVRRGDVGQSQHAVGQRLDPLADGVGPAQGAQGGAEPGDQLGHPAGQVEVGTVEVVQAQGGAQVVHLLAVDGGADEHPRESGLPGVLAQPGQGVVTPVLVVETPADRRRHHPVAEPLEVVVVEPETSTHGRGAGEVEHLPGAEAAPGEPDQPGGQREQRVGHRRGPVGQAHPQGVRRVGGEARRRGAALAHHLAEPEAGVHQRGVGVDVGAHDEDVARLQGRVLLQQVGEHVAQHLDLPGPAVAGVHLDAAVLLRDVPGAPLGVGRHVVGLEVPLEQAQQRGRRPAGAVRAAVGPPAGPSLEGMRCQRQGALQLAGVPPQAGEQRVVHEQRGVVLRAGHRPRGGGVGQRVPGRR